MKKKCKLCGMVVTRKFGTTGYHCFNCGEQLEEWEVEDVENGDDV
jgi:predicted RNA-binding Zn-ribbon protein involved in translation (DUF1610 family)